MASATSDRDLFCLVHPIACLDYCWHVHPHLKMIHGHAMAGALVQQLSLLQFTGEIILHNRQITDRANGKLINRHWRDAMVENGNIEMECASEISTAALQQELSHFIDTVSVLAHVTVISLPKQLILC